MTNTPVGPITRWMLLICERDCSSTETKRSWLVLRWWLGVADRAGVKVERPERGGDDDLDAGEGGHRMQQRRTSLGGTVASGDHSNRRPPPEPLAIGEPRLIALSTSGSRLDGKRLHVATANRTFGPDATVPPPAPAR
jgi:hypothetical protein